MMLLAQHTWLLPVLAFVVSALLPMLALADGQNLSAAGGGLAITGTQTLQGTLLEAGVECPQFRLATGSAEAAEAGDGDTAQAGEVISLTGAAPQDLGTYTLTGRWPRFSYCMQGRSFDVQTYVETGSK